MTTQEIKSALVWAQGVQQAVAFSKVLDANLMVNYTPANDNREDDGVSVTLILHGAHTNEVAYRVDAAQYTKSAEFAEQAANVERLLKAFISGYGKEEDKA